MIKTKHGTCTIYIYGSLCISFNVFCIVCKGEHAFALQLLAICLSLDFVYLVERPVSVIVYSLCVEPLTHLKCCICFTETEEFPFHLLLSLPSPWHAVFSLFQVNLKIHWTLHREQTEKCFFRGENKVFWCWFLSPQRTLWKERFGETGKSFSPSSFLADLDCSWWESGLHVW